MKLLKKKKHTHFSLVFKNFTKNTIFYENFIIIIWIVYYYFIIRFILGILWCYTLALLILKFYFFLLLTIFHDFFVFVLVIIHQSRADIQLWCSLYIKFTSIILLVSFVAFTNRHVIQTHTTVPSLRSFSGWSSKKINIYIKLNVYFSYCSG